MRTTRILPTDNTAVFMRKQDHLVQLIGALGTNEKRYFKLYSGLQPGEKRYLRLFDALEKKARYDTKELCAELEITSKQLTDDKYYLTQLLLQSLRSYDNDSSEVIQLRNQLANVQVLINRRLFNFAVDIVEKQLARAIELEAFELIDSFLAMRSTCLQNAGRLNEGLDMLQIHQQTSKQLSEVIELSHLRALSRGLEIKGAAAIEFQHVISNPLVQKPIAQLSSLRAKSLRYEIMAHYYQCMVNDPALLQSSREERELYLANPSIKIINPIVYLTNLMRLSSGEENPERRMHYIQLLNQELDTGELNISKQRADSLRWGAMLCSLWNLRYLNRFADALELVSLSSSSIEGRSEYERFTATFEYALILLHNNKPSEALDKIDDLLRYKSDVRSNMQPFVRLLQLMAQLQMGQFNLIPHTVKSAKHWIKQHKAEHAEISLFFKHCAAFAKYPLQKRKQKALFLTDITEGRLANIDRLLHLQRWIAVGL